MPECLQCQPDGKGSASREKHSMLPLATVVSVGNEGNQGSATNLATWMFSIAASSTDRDFSSDMSLGNGANFMPDVSAPGLSHQLLEKCNMGLMS
ncbi:hypothetical protein Dsin_011524 [Dipteronia sinensis]|uniref:Uncharacterized protein n=1 Tax=Dipteronia sinensis TaxID=43782 RepID=A0AAE0EDW4_9ROSI|nr:hypothetical protein Dsin_011524 [Dipteronia sinensis]